MNWWPCEVETVPEPCVVLWFFLTCLVDYYSDAEEYDSDEIFESLEEEPTNLLKCYRQKVFPIDTLSNISPKEVDNIPYDIDGLCVFVIKTTTTLKFKKNVKMVAHDNKIAAQNAEILIRLDIKTVVVASFVQTINANI